jgi:hypothetical protein
MLPAITLPQNRTNFAFIYDLPFVCPSRKYL